MLSACFALTLSAAGQNAMVPPNEKFARVLARAEEGHAEDQVKLGVALQFGQGVAPDVSQAAHWFLKAANQGDPAAQTNIAYLYLEGQGVPRSEREAFTWFQRAAVEQYAPAQAGLASAVSNAKLLRQLLHGLSCLQNSVDIRGLKAAAAGDAAPPGAVDDLGVGPLASGHREDDRLHAANLALGVGSRHLTLQGGSTGNHVEDPFE